MPRNEEATITLKLLAADLASGKVGAFIGHLDQLAKKGGLVGSVAQGVGQGLGQMLNPIGLVTRGIGALTDVLGDSLSKAAEEEAGIRRLTTSIRENDAAWDGNMDRIEGVIKGRERLAFSDGDQRDSLATLTAVTKDVNRALALQADAMDLARLRGMDLRTASDVLGKVYAGNVGILSRYGVQLRRGASATEALAEVHRMAKGQARAYAGSLAGKQESLAIAIEDVQEEIGGLLAGPAEQFADFLMNVISGGIDAGSSVHALAESIRSDLRPALGGMEAVNDEIDRLYERTASAPEFGAGTLVDSWQDLLDSLRGGDEINDWVWRTTQLGDALGVTRQGLAELAQAVKDSGGTFEDYQGRLEGLATQAGIVLPARLKGLIAAFESLPDTARGAMVETLAQAERDALLSLSLLPADMRATLDGGAADVKAGARALVEPIGTATTSAVRRVKADVAELVPFVTGRLERVRDAKGKPMRWRVDLDHQLTDLRRKFRVDLAAIEDLIDNPPGQKARTDLEEQIEAIERKRRRALAGGKWEAFEEANRALESANAELDRLNRREVVAKVRMVFETSGAVGLARTVLGGSVGAAVGGMLPRRAEGGPVREGEPYVVGERGPELFVPGRSGAIVPNRGIGPSIHLHFGYTTASPAEAQRFAEAVTPHIQRAMARRL